MSDSMQTHHGPGGVHGPRPVVVPDRSNRNRNLLAGILGGLILWSVFWGGDDPPPGDTLPAAPAELQGTWRTDAEAYADRFMAIRANDMVMGFGAEAPEAFLPLVAIRTWRGEGFNAYALDYGDPDGPQSMEVHVYPDGTLRLRNPDDVVWRRVE